MKKSLQYKIVGIVVACAVVWGGASATYFKDADSDAPNDLNLQQDSVPSNQPPVNLRYSITDESGNPYLEDEEGGVIDLGKPENLDYQAEYDPETETITLYRKVGGINVRLPYTMTLQEYLDLDTRRSIISYWHQRQQMESGQYSGSNIFNQSFRFGGAAFNSIFGSNLIDIKLQGTAELKVGFSTTKVDNPTLQERLRKTTTFDFEENIQMNINGNIGDKLQLGINYNTQSLFDFENQVKLEYTGDEDEIIQKIEAGNVSMPLPGTLITGSQSLFGVKSELKFGKLTVTSIFSQQKGESKSINMEGGASKQEFEVTADQYDKNRHFFLSHRFRNKYDEALSTLPIINSGYNIERVEVWVTNKQGNFDDSRNIVAFLDLAESGGNVSQEGQPVWGGQGAIVEPENDANTLYNQMNTTYSAIRDINNVTSTLQVLQSKNIFNGVDYEKIESARMLNPSEYKVNYKLGYISLNTLLQADEVLAVAYEYTYQGKKYQVGEFSTDRTAPESLILKLIKGTNLTPDFKNWDLMMKNVYSLGALQINREDFELHVVMNNDSTGTEINYFPEGKEPPNGINKEILLSVMNLDQLNSLGEPTPDGIFDYIEGVTINSQSGRVIFPELEPFGSKYLGAKIKDPDLTEKYAYDELYNETQTIATQTTDKNRFKLKGSYKSSGGGGEISLNAMNVPRGSVVVTAGGIKLIENVDYTVDYTMGRVKIINQGYLNSGTPIQVSLESQSLYNLQTKTLMGTHMDYAFNDNLNIGGTVMHLRERPLTQKVNIGSEPIANTIWGLNGSYTTQSQGLTNLIDKLPFVVATKPSNIAFEGEFAQLIPGHPDIISSEGNAYIDDFEGTKISYDMKYWLAWKLASVPQGQPNLISHSNAFDSLEAGYGRAKLAWYVIDPMFLRSTSTTPSHIKDDVQQKSNHFVREIYENELFPNKQQAYGAQSNIPVLNLAYYPKERGPYNYDADNIDSDGSLLNPEDRWGGVMRKIETPDFEAANIEYIEFWLMDPFVYDNSSQRGGELYFNLGDVSEDILRDSRKAFEQGLPAPDENQSLVDTTTWGRVPTKQSTVNGFNLDPAARRVQDVGLDGFSSVDEKSYFASAFVDKITQNSNLPDEVKDEISKDPSSDDYHYFRGSDFDQNRTSILDRYKNYNNTEGNSVATEYSPESYSTAAYNFPDVEDINQDNTLSENESYYQYRVDLRPERMIVGENYITNKITREVTLANGNTESINWYQFKIPVDSWEERVGNINDYRSIRFMRMFLNGFQDTVILRFATMDLVRGEWRKYDSDNLNGTTNSATEFVVSAVNIEEDADRKPVRYDLPPGFDRVIDPSNPQLRELNEQSISLKVTDLGPKEAQAVYKTTNFDMRQYKRLKMEVHAEAVEGMDLKDKEVSAFIRLGMDSKNNYYEYEVPLKLTPYGSISRDSIWPEANRIDVALSEFTDVKLMRNESNKPLTDEYPHYEENYIIKIKGNPTLGNVKTIMIGIRSNDPRESKSVEVWYNELRLTNFDEDGGWAANARMKIGLSDLGSISLAGKTSTQGFGSIDQSVTERSQEDFYQYDIATNIEAGKLLGPNNRLSVPLYYGYSKAVATPKYYPLDTDITVEQALKNADSEHARDSIKNISQEVTTRKSFNLTNVRLTPKNDSKPSVISPSNLSATYSFNETNKHDINTEYAIDKNYRGNLAYNYNARPKPVEPFKKAKVFAPNSLALIRDFNFYYFPTQISYRVELDRRYSETQLRNISNPDFKIPVTVRKDFFMNRYFDLNFSLTKSLKLNFKATTNARIDEPDGPVSKDRYRDEYQQWKDEIMQNILSFGRTTNYRHTTNVTYQVPINKFPLLDWTSLNASYNSMYTWLVGPITTKGKPSVVGNTIQNSNNLSLNSTLDLKRLYNKSSYFKELDRKYSTRRRAGSQNQKRTVRFSKDNVAMEAGKATTINHKLKTTDVKLRVFDANGRPVQGKTDIVSPNKIEFTPVDSHDQVRISVTGTVEDVNTPLRVITDYTAMLLTGVKNINAQYGVTNGTILPGYKKGSDWSQSGFGEPGLPFIFGIQDRDFAWNAVQKGWLADTSLQTNPYIMNHSEDFSARISFEPFRGFKIELNGDRKFMKNLNEFYIFHDEDEVFTQENTRYRGSFNMSFNIFKTAFWKVDKSGLYRSKAYDNFLEYRQTIADRLGEKRNGMEYSTIDENNNIVSTIYRPDEISAQDGGGVDGYSLNSQDVLIPAFLAAYSGKSPDNIFLDPFPGFSRIQPNWKFTYDGLSRLKMFKKVMKSFTISHTYRSTYSVGSYISNYENIEEIRDALIWRRDAQGNFLPLNQINSVSLNEQFSPLIQFNITWQNSLTTRAEIKKSRVLNLNLTNNQLIENYTDEYIIGLGYKLDQLPLNIGNKSFNSDVNFRADLSVRENLAIIRKIMERVDQLTSGQRIMMIKFTADYALSDRFNMQLFYDRNINKPYLSTAYPTSTANFGLSFRFSLTQ